MGLGLIRDAGGRAPTVRLMDRMAILYLVLPLIIFAVGWIQWWAAIPLVLLIGYPLRSLFIGWADAGGFGLSRAQLGIAIGVGCVWVLLGGMGHVFFANADWAVRDAVLNDLVTGEWPVGYGTYGTSETILRAPLGYYLFPALVGKWTTLSIGHVMLAVWTGIGAALFLAQVLSVLPARPLVASAAAIIIVLFSGWDILGSLFNGGVAFREQWNAATHIEWWATQYQYSSMTTQLFWVPNHALGGWLFIGLLYRNERNPSIDPLLPMMVVALALWSPLTAIGVLPFVLWRFLGSSERGAFKRMLNFRIWSGAAVVGIVVAYYLLLDAGRVPKGVLIGSRAFESVGAGIAHHLNFFLLEAGLVGFAVLAIRRTKEVVAALVILLVLPAFYLGVANDFVMRASIPSIAVLAIAACVALFQPSESKNRQSWLKKALLVFCLAVGAVTALQEIARAVMVKPWPIDESATVISGFCGEHPAHYIAAMPPRESFGLLRRPHPIETPPFDPRYCWNPATLQMIRAGVL